MFEYAREFIINDDIKTSTNESEGMVKLEGLATYKVGKDSSGNDYILSFTEIAHKPEVVPEIDIPFSTDATKEQKIVIESSLYRAQEGSYANNLRADMAKMFQFEFKKGTSINKAVDIINEAMHPYGGDYFSVKVSGANIHVTGVEGEQALAAKKYLSTGLYNYHDDEWEEAAKIDKVAGTKPFGTYEHLMHSHRLPTEENTNYFSTNKYKMPIPGAKYKLIEFKYNSGIRNIGGAGVVGSYERSITTHRFWINTNATLTDFDAVMKIIKDNAFPVGG